MNKGTKHYALLDLVKPSRSDRRLGVVGVAGGVSLRLIITAGELTFVFSFRTFRV